MVQLDERFEGAMKTANAEDVIVLLSYDQRMELFEQTGLHLCRLLFNVRTGSAQPVDKCCSRCLLNDGLPDVTILGNGMCNHCAEFQAQVEAGHYDDAKLRELIERYKG